MKIVLNCTNVHSYITYACTYNINSKLGNVAVNDRAPNKTQRLFTKTNPNNQTRTNELYFIQGCIFFCLTPSPQNKIYLEQLLGLF